jgi:hypothetical protein
MKRKPVQDISDTNRARKRANAGDNRSPKDSKATSIDRAAGFSQGEKVLGFFGGWPYVGVIGATQSIRMSFGLVYLYLIRWNGFSGKNAQTWVSELDVMPLNEDAIKMKQSMEEMLRQRTKEAGGKLTVLQQRKVFSEIVEQFRGKSLAPLRPHTCPYGDEWQTIVRVSAMPKMLVDHLRGTEALMNERKIAFTFSDPSVCDTLNNWTQSGDSAVSRDYVETVKMLFNKYILKSLLYKFELPLVYKRVIESGSEDYSATLPVEYFLRLCNLIPQILTAACSGVMNKNESMTVSSFFSFVNAHQSFMQYLVGNMDTLLRTPRKKATLNEPASETCWIGSFLRSESKLESCDDEVEVDKIDTIPDRIRIRAKLRSKRKGRIPMFKPPSKVDVPVT